MLLRLIASGAFLVGYLGASARYAVLYSQHSQNLFSQARGLDLLVLSLVSAAYAVAVIALRQIFSDLGMRFPCTAMRVANIAVFAIYVPVTLCRALVVAVKLNDHLRKRFMAFITPRARSKVLTAVFSIIAGYLLTVGRSKACLTKR
jgi:hypothetical protein